LMCRNIFFITVRKYRKTNPEESLSSKLFNISLESAKKKVERAKMRLSNAAGFTEIECDNQLINELDQK